jgi:hypothetical protein
VHFNGDGCMEINTEGMTYITLSIDTLHDMLYLLEEAELKLSKQSKICEI